MNGKQKKTVVEYCSATKKIEILIHATIGTHFENPIPNKRSQSQKTT